jgi:hypothetical protein
MPSALETFLQCHPWSESGLLERVFEPKSLRSMLRQNPLRISRSEWGERWAVSGEADLHALSLSRVETARAFAWWNFGRDGFFTSRSPGRQCDMEIIWKGESWRVYVDPGGIAPEAIPWIQHPPADPDGPRVVLSDRATMLAHWLCECWSGESVQVGGKFNPPWSFADRKSDPFLFPLPLRGIRRKPARTPRPDIDQLPLPMAGDDLRLSANFLGRLSLIGGPWLPAALSSIGFLPFLTIQECHFLDPQLFSAFHLKFLRTEQLVQGDRMTLSPSGLRMIAGFWGSDPEGLSRRHPWPLRFERRNRRWAYSKGAARFGLHDTLVRRFMLALVEGARRVSSPSLGLEVVPTTILGSRIRYGEGRGKASSVLADARASLRVVRGRLVQRECELLMEMDRGTYSFAKLEERLAKYRDLLSGTQRTFELVMVFPNTDREENALRVLHSFGLPAWTATEGRLVLSPASAWWLKNPYLGAGLPRESTGGYCPWRAIWRNAAYPEAFSSLLDVQKTQIMVR